jgi:hypothetical protein
MEELKVRNQELLESIREKNNVRNEFDRGSDQIASRSFQTTQRSNEGIDRSDDRIDNESAAAYRTTRRSDEQSRRTAGSNEYESESSNTSSAKTRRKRLKDLSPEEQEQEIQRRHELKLERQARYDEKKRLEKQSQIESGTDIQNVSPDDSRFFEKSELKTQSERQNISQKTSDRIKNKIPSPSDIKMTLKGKKADLSEVKLIKESEAAEKIEKLTDLFIRGSNLLDQVLQIIVKGHEEVYIWTLDEDTARIFAIQQVEAAKTNKEAAHTVSRLEAIHSNIFKIQVFAPRMIATGKLVKEKGLGFK